MRAEFDLTELERGIAGTRFAGVVTHLPTTGSTNQVALEAAAAGARNGVWVADEQTAGRGRGGHTWHSVVGDGLYVSALVTLGVSMADAPKIPLATGVAVQAGILEATGLRLDIRWPNDLMFGDRKCGGILVESVSETSGAGLRYAVIGVGINVNHAAFPPELRALATSLTLESGRRFEREPLLAAILSRLNDELELLDAGDGGLLERFSSASSWASGKYVKVDEDSGYTGWTCGLDAQGFLQVKGDDGRIRTVLSGGVRSALER